jgi:protein involved in temperature-dependent protein secretion
MAPAAEWNQQTLSYPAGAAIPAHRFVKFDANRAVIACSATTDRPIGIVTEAVEAGETARICYSGIALLEASAAIALNALVGTTADGSGVALTPGAAATAYVAAIAHEAAGADGDLIAVLVTPATNIALTA